METKRKIIWTRAARDLLYQRAIELFGPYSKWENNRSPGRGMDAQYDLFCHAFAELVGAESGKAVKMQLEWAMPLAPGNKRNWAPSHARSMILAMASAFEAGFIDNSHFPTLIAIGPEVDAT